MTNEEKAALVSEVSTAVAASLATQLDAFKADLQAAKETAQNTAKSEATAAVTAAVESLKTEIATLTSAVNAERDAERQTLVQFLAQNNRTPFTQAELEAMPLPQLQKLSDMVDPTPTFFGARGGPRTSQNTAEEEFIEPTPYFKKVDASTTTA